MPKQPKIEEGFKITYELVDNAHKLTIAPEKESEGYGAVTIEVNEAHWNALQYAFMIGINERNGETKLCYLQ